MKEQKFGFRNLPEMEAGMKAQELEKEVDEPSETEKFLDPTSLLPELGDIFVAPIVIVPENKNADGIRLQVYNCGGLAVRREPDKQAPLTAPHVLAPGTHVLVVDVENEWSKVKFANGDYAYLLSEYLMGIE